jgi:recombination protein RecR
MLPKAVRDLTHELHRLPGIGPKTAQRLAVYLLRQPDSRIKQLASVLSNLQENVRICTTCYNLAEDTTCDICSNGARVSSLVCVVEDALDVDAIERTNAYHGRYHVLGGALSPLEGIGPDQLTLNELFLRIPAENIKEVIIALDATTESDATTRHIINHLRGSDIKITRLGRGLPTGGDIEFADSLTLLAAFQGRTAA